jgi:hypothetical protein
MIKEALHSHLQVPCGINVCTIPTFVSFPVVWSSSSSQLNNNAGLFVASKQSLEMEQETQQLRHRRKVTAIHLCEE